jgi:hypothetical protein
VIRFIAPDGAASEEEIVIHVERYIAGRFGSRAASKLRGLICSGDDTGLRNFAYKLLKASHPWKDAENAVRVFLNPGFAKALRLRERAEAESRRTHATQAVLREVAPFFDVISALLPKRLAKEDVGEAIDYIKEQAQKYEGRFLRTLIMLKVASTCFWLGIATAREIASIVIAKAKSTPEKKAE